MPVSNVIDILTTMISDQAPSIVSIWKRRPFDQHYDSQPLMLNAHEPYRDSMINTHPCRQSPQDSPLLLSGALIEVHTIPSRLRILLKLEVLRAQPKRLQKAIPQAF